MLEIQISLSSKEYIYGLRVRPFGIAAQPKGHTAFTPPSEIPADLQKLWNERDFRFGILHYPSKLSERDIDHYDLTDLNEPTDKEKWERFEKFVKEVAEYDLDFKEFVEDYIKPRAEYKDMNPLAKEKPNVLFDLLSKNGYSGNLKGLEIFYNSLK